MSWDLVQHQAAYLQAANSVFTVAYAGAQSAGDLNVIVLTWFDNITVTSVVDSANGAYTLAGSRAVNGTTIFQAIYYRVNIGSTGAGSNVVTVTFSGTSNYSSFNLMEWSGGATSSIIDVTAINSGSSPTLTVNATTIADGDLVLATYAMYAGGGTSVASGFTLVDENTTAGIGVDYLIKTPAGSVTATRTHGNDIWCASMVTFKVATGGGGGPTWVSQGVLLGATGPAGPIVLATTSAAGAVPALVTAGSGSGQQQQVWLRGDDSWQGLTSTQITGALGFTPLNKAGDSMGGTLGFGGFSYTVDTSGNATFHNLISDSVFTSYWEMRQSAGHTTLTSANLALATTPITGIANISIDGNSVSATTSPCLLFQNLNKRNLALQVDASGLWCITDLASPVNIIDANAKVKWAALSGGPVFGSIIADFGTTDNGGADEMHVKTTVAATWLTATSCPTISLSAAIVDHLDADDLLGEEIVAYVANPIVGTSFEIMVVAPNGTWGRWQVNYQSNLI